MPHRDDPLPPQFSDHIKISTPYGVGQITHVQPEHEMLLSELFQHARLDQLEFLLSMGSIYIDDKRALQDKKISPTSVVRVHRNPKRHPVGTVDWSQVIVDENEHFVIVNKPYNIPVHATVDNLRENVIFQVSHYLKCPVHVTHRLDVETTGLLVLAKTKVFQNVFNFLLQSKKVIKKYKALTEKKPPTGLIRHYIQNSQFAPKLVSSEPIEGWPLCELIIHETRPVTLAHGKPGFESDITLLTGRTHQIRAQMTALVGPLFGDSQYGDEENKNYALGLQAYALSFSWPALQKEFNYIL